LIEHLTDEIEAQARRYLERIDAMGGALPAIERGYLQAEIHEAAYQAQRAVERGDSVVVGVNKFRTETSVHLEVQRVDPRVEAEQRRRLETLRARRDAGRAASLLGRLRLAAESDENLVGLFVEAVEADVTLGEICNTLREVWGEYRPASPW
jgi:methylmalonyl-CoA mutase N-terminal domain/subunit